MISFLTLLGILIAPISGVFVINAFDRKAPVSEEELAGAPDWRVSQLSAWLSGAVVGYIATPASALGLGLIQLTTMPTLDSILAAGVVMLTIKLFCQSAAAGAQSAETLAVAPTDP
jgi:cytosine permease